MFQLLVSVLSCQLLSDRSDSHAKSTTCGTGFRKSAAMASVFPAWRPGLSVAVAAPLEATLLLQWSPLSWPVGVPSASAAAKQKT